MIVVSEITASSVTTQTPPAMQEDMSTIIISGLFAVTASAIGMSIPIMLTTPDAKLEHKIRGRTRRCHHD